MARTIAEFHPDAAEFKTSAFPQLLRVGSTPVLPALAYDASTVEAAIWSWIVPQGITSTVTANIYYIMASATSSKVDFEISVQSDVIDGSRDLDAADSFDTVNAGNETVPGTAGYLGCLSITLTNKDSWAAGHYARIKVERDADDATDDTATGDCYVLYVELQDS